MSESVVALIVDIVKSRELKDRVGAQRSIREAFEWASHGRPTRRSLWPTVGDEFQAIFFTLGDALLTTSLVRLALPEGVDCRFGLGRGETVDVDEWAPGTIQDGSAWWNAREAIEETHRREHGTAPYLRSWFVTNNEGESGTVALVNGFLLLRDASISSMRPRDRRLTAGTLLGYSQTELARQEGVTQSAVSQSLRRSGGAALLAAHQELRKGQLQ
ncbi:SatD family protein [Arthrobacter sp. FW306-2-2C-D06B]|uniref:SatD family protein n=1 Tax=Arthrobacter sp. FW306-2-2C-D06B TaxID=2879618 RepID=UPI001F45F829|nr:SatD family protein [Arthrobacter sp. FW306-2-2C-D06B]UKA59292.1 SatD family protein [Arthrobacter sp. FW306-2-2C-D06B]